MSHGLFPYRKHIQTKMKCTCHANWLHFTYRLKPFQSWQLSFKRQSIEVQHNVSCTQLKIDRTRKRELSRFSCDSSKVALHQLRRTSDIKYLCVLLRQVPCERKWRLINCIAPMATLNCMASTVIDFSVVKNWLFDNRRRRIYRNLNIMIIIFIEIDFS